MVELGDIIEVESSPEPVTRVRDKGKGKETFHQRIASVIELTDSESEGVLEYSSQHTPVFASSSSSGTTLNGHVHQQPLFLPSDDPPANTERVDVGVIENAPNPDPQPQIPPPDVVPRPDFDPVPIDMDPTSTAVAQILEIIPNVEPTHLLNLVETHLPTFAVPQDAGGGQGGEQQVQGVVGHVLHLLFEDPNYPKADKKGKGKRVAEVEEKVKEIVPKKPKVDYATVDRPYPVGPNYFDLVLYHLQSSFPHIPKPYLRRQLQIHKNLYAPTHLSILATEKTFEENKQLQRPYTVKSIRHALRKPQDDIAFDEEKAWLDAELGIAVGKGVDTAEEVVDADIDDVDDGTGIECQCCFADYPFSKMVQCPEAHLFCSTCISTYAATQLGTHNSSLTCIHSSSCSLPFPTSELKRILPVKLYELYERLEQQKQIMQAGLVGLEECPFCEWKCVLEASSEEDKLFRCGNEDGGCGAVSCRGCKKLDHLPKSCKEVEEDKHLDGRHAIEEAMTRAMMRNCPTCQKAFIKELGCNKMSCPNCHTLSCYICRQVIKGYDHFNQAARGAASTSANSKKCLLWEPVEERHAQEVKEAAEKAMREYKRDHPDVEESAIKVDIPEAPAAAQAPAPGPYAPIMPMAFNYQNPYQNLNVGQVHPQFAVPVPVLPPPPGQAQDWHQQLQLQQQQLQQQLQLLQRQPQHQAVDQRQQPVRQQPQRYANARAQARATRAVEQQQQRQRTAKPQRARMAEQVRLAQEHRARHGLDRVREQRAVARREQQERARLAMELARQRQQQPQPQAQVQVQVQQVQGQGLPQAAGQARQEPYRRRRHPQQQQQQQQQPQPQPPQMMAPPPQVAENPRRRGRARKKKS